MHGVERTEGGYIPKCNNCVFTGKEVKISNFWVRNSHQKSYKETCKTFETFAFKLLFDANILAKLQAATGGAL